ncbi:hypothetical protein LP414_27755 [Polaromonas sp. P1(28)-13]|nr:hypothetical protein LP414_27755 [Polaromonas sp. P1(28)-13]
MLAVTASSWNTHCARFKSAAFLAEFDKYVSSDLYWSYMPKPTKLPKPGAIALIDPAQVDTAGSTAPMTDEQKRIRTLVDRRHPEYEENSVHWKFLDDTYDGGREWFKNNVFKYIKEGDGEYADRLERCYRFNHTREVVDLVNKYLFKQLIVRNTADAPCQRCQVLGKLNEKWPGHSRLRSPGFKEGFNLRPHWHCR